MNTASHQTVSSGHYSNSFGSSEIDKYGGMLPLPLLKQIRNKLFILNAHVQSEAPKITISHAVISIIRLLQLLGPALFVPFPAFWNREANVGKLVSVMSISFHLIPPEFRIAAAPAITYTYFSLIFAFLLLILIASHIFKTNATLPDAVPIIIYVFISTVGWVSHPVALEITAEVLSTMIAGDHSNMTRNILHAVLVMLTFGLYALLQRKVFSTTVLFRPASLMTVMPGPQTALFEITCLVTFILGLASRLSGISKLCLMLTASLCYASIAFFCFRGGGFVNRYHRRFVASFASASVLLTFVFAFWDSRQGSETLLFTLAFGILLDYFIVSFIHQNRIKKQLLALDSQSFEIKSVTEFAATVITGFEFAHPECISLAVFKKAASKWPDSEQLWLLFAKFTAIFPDEGKTLAWILHQIQSVKGTKQVSAEIVSLMRQREASLSPQLKGKLSSLGKSVAAVKHKLRHIWDLVIQGNTGEMESVISRTAQGIEKVEAGFRHLVRQYPNCRFVVRSYARFKLEVCADHEAFRFWAEKGKGMQRGIRDNDKAMDLGLSVFTSIPFSTRPRDDVFVPLESESQLMDFKEDDEEGIGVSEQIALLRKKIEKLKIPGISFSYVVISLIFLLLFAIPMLGVGLFIDYQSTKWEAPLEEVDHLALIRENVFSLPLLGIRFAHDTLEYADPAKAQKTRMTLNEALIQTLEGLQNITVGGSVLFWHLSGDSENLTLDSGIMSIVIGLGSLVDEGANPNSYIEDHISEALANSGGIADSIGVVMSAVVTSMEDTQARVSRNSIITIVAVSILAPSIMGICVLFQSKILIQNKLLIYRCLTSIPKNHVSVVADTLKMMSNKDETSSKSDTDSELNKQEENIFKIFITASDSSVSNLSSHTLSIIGIVVLIILHFTCTMIIGMLFINIVGKVSDVAPHLDSVFGAIAYQMGSLSSFLSLSTSLSKSITFPGISNERLYNEIYDRMNTSSFYFHQARFGSPTNSLAPFDAFNSGVKNIVQNLECDETRHPTLIGSMTCFTPEMAYILFEPLVNSLAIPFKEAGTPISIMDPDVESMFDIQYYTIFKKLFEPIINSIVYEAEQSIDAAMVPSLTAIYVILGFTGLLTLLLIQRARSKDSELKFAMSLLLHYQPSVILSLPLVPHILSGDFRISIADTTSRDSEFFDNLVEQLPDAVIITNPDGSLTLNKSASRLFPEGPPSLTPRTESLTTASGFFEVTVMMIEGLPVYTLRDVTQARRYRTLIEEELSKADRLLQSILPPKLVPRVQAGEQNISFSVQSASIVFVDIVEFTPWCSEQPATKIMKTLNALFMLFDSIVSTLPTMTRVKCIGDCYMAAGGIFSEVNQPTVHATEAVTFGLRAIEAVEEVNRDTGSNLKIRVGVNTGGPIVGGVLGIGKPTFEILGPAINLAQQMEHHGVEGCVHISRSVYELIYGADFMIKERGEITIKNGRVETYLVMRK